MNRIKLIYDIKNDLATGKIFYDDHEACCEEFDRLVGVMNSDKGLFFTDEEGTRHEIIRLERVVNGEVLEQEDKFFF